MIGLTTQQSDCLHYLRDYQSLRGISPTQQEIATALHLKSKSGVTRLLLALEDKNYIRRMSKRARSIELLHQGSTCPRCGHQISLAAAVRETPSGIPPSPQAPARGLIHDSTGP